MEVSIKTLRSFGAAPADYIETDTTTLTSSKTGEAHVFHNVIPFLTSEPEVYEMTMEKTVKQVIDGINGCVLLWGDRMGNCVEYANMAIESIFKQVQADVNRIWFVRVAAYEIYDQKVRNLLTQGEVDPEDEQANKYTFHTIISEAHGNALLNLAQEMLNHKAFQIRAALSHIIVDFRIESMTREYEDKKQSQLLMTEISTQTPSTLVAEQLIGDLSVNGTSDAYGLSLITQHLKPVFNTSCKISILCTMNLIGSQQNNRFINLLTTAKKIACLPDQNPPCEFELSYIYEQVVNLSKEQEPEAEEARRYASMLLQSPAADLITMSMDPWGDVSPSRDHRMSLLTSNLDDIPMILKDETPLLRVSAAVPNEISLKRVSEGEKPKPKYSDQPMPSAVGRKKSEEDDSQLQELQEELAKTKLELAEQQEANGVLEDELALCKQNLVNIHKQLRHYKNSPGKSPPSK